MKIIGVTGPSGSGKTVLTKYFNSIGVPTVDADEVYHSMLVPPSECLDAIRESFGNQVFLPDGGLDRTALGSVVFNDSEKLKLLNSTVLGMVLEKIRNMIADFDRKDCSAVIIDAPTLIESGFNDECDVVVSVIAPMEDRIARISQRDNISEDKARERVTAQKNDEFYKSHSDFVIFNDTNECDFLTKIKNLASEFEITAQ